MRYYEPEKIHNIGLFGHVGCGKTTLTEAILYTTQAISRMGRVEDGTTVSDFDPDEQRRTMSINLSVVPVEWDGHKINLIDVPGYADFAGDMAAAMRVIDGLIIVVDATGGVEVGTELAYEMAQQADIPCMFFVNKLDRENANFYRCVDHIREVLDANAIPLYIPLGTSQDFQGVISLRTAHAYYTSEKHDGSFESKDVPLEQDHEMHDWRSELIDKIAATTDDLIEKYLELGEDALSHEERVRGLRLGMQNHSITPVLCGSATEVAGVAQLLKNIIEEFPTAAQQQISATALASGTTVPVQASADEPLTALVFKTIADPYGKMSFYRVYSGTLQTNQTTLNTRASKEERCAHLYQVRGKEQAAVEKIGPGDIGMTTKLMHTETGDTLCAPERPLSLPAITFPRPAFTAVVKPHGRGDLDKLGMALHRMLEEDPTLQTARDDSTGETLLSGLGESHLTIVAERMRRKFDTHVDIGLPRVAYRETIRTTAEANYRHKKQSGGAGQFADVSLRVEPLPHDPERTDPLEFVSEIVGGVVSRGFWPAIEKGVREAMAEGILIGSPVVDVRVALFDGKEHPVDSKEIAFKIAGAQAFKQAALKASPIITEPVYELHITVPEHFAGDIMSDISTRRGRVQGMMPAESTNKTIITAHVPLAECQRYATDLRAMTQARGTFTMVFCGYEEVPAHLVDGLIAAHQHEHEAVVH